MLTEQYCSYEVAKLLKEKGFPMNEHLRIYINKDNLCLTDVGMMSYLSKEDYIHFEDFFIPTITHQMAMAWLREIHNLWCEISWEGKGLWFVDVFSLIDEEYIPGSIIHEVKSYEEAVEAALKYSLENLI